MAGDALFVIDGQMKETNHHLNQNVEQIKRSNETFEKEMQQRFQRLIDRSRKLDYSKQKMLEDIDFIIRSEHRNLNQTANGPSKKQLSYPKDTPLLQYFEEPDLEKKLQLQKQDKLKITSAAPIDKNSTNSSFMSGFSDVEEKIDKDFPTSIKLNFKPLVIKQLSGVWLLVSGSEPKIEIFSLSTLRLQVSLET